jgi:predicted RNA-binding protein with PIN domain
MSESEEVIAVSSTELPESAGPLSEAVRARVIAYAADALARMPAEHLPPALKRVASFASARRARLAGNQISSILETDPEFREHLANQIRVQAPELAKAVDSGTPPAVADPVEVAALGYLLRPEGWAHLVRAAGSTAEVERAAALTHRAAEQIERLQRQLDSALEELKTLKLRSREQSATHKAENTELRRKLGEARARAKTEQHDASEAQASAAEATADAERKVSATEAENRRLRARIEELERELAGARREQKSERGSEALRARLLLDTLLDTAQGLRRELALPAVEGSPADFVEAHLAEEGGRTFGARGATAPDDPVMLEQLMSLPRVHLIVDGYNVTKSSWPQLSLENQRDRLLSGLAHLIARLGTEVTVVFDAAELKDRPPLTRPRGVRVLYSPFGVIADDVIRELVAAEPAGRPLVVVTEDQAIVRDVKHAGARVVAAPALSRLLGRT